MGHLHKSILETLAWFDIFDYPITCEELFKCLWQGGKNISYTDFLGMLDEMEEKQSIKRTFGYYTLPGRVGLVERRNQTIALIEHKMKIAKKAAKAISWIPFVEAIFLCNTVAFGWPKKESDIDFFIITKKGRLWLTRFLITLVLSARGLRRNKKRISDRVCLSFYATDNALNMRDIAIDDMDIYLVYWILHLIPLFISEEGIDSPYFANFWVTHFVPDISEHNTLNRYITTHGKVGNVCRKILSSSWSGTYGDILEKQARNIQQMKMKRNKHSIQDEKDTRVVISDTRLKFHENDRRLLYKEMWIERCKDIFREV